MSMETPEDAALTPSDSDYLVYLAGCSLAKSPKANWIEKTPQGELPEYICRVARALVRKGRDTSSAIAIAVSTVKRWAAGADDVNADTRAKAAAAVAEWEALKAASHAKSAKLANFTQDGDTEIVSLCQYDFSVDEVKRAWYENVRPVMDDEADPHDDPYVAEAWNSFLLIQQGTKKFQVPYEVTTLGVEFGDPIEVRVAYVPLGVDPQELESELMAEDEEGSDPGESPESTSTVEGA